MKRKKALQRFGKINLTIAMLFTCVANTLPSAHAAERDSKSNTYKTIGTVTEASADGNVVDLKTTDEKIRITFLDEGIFRLNMEKKDNDFVDKPNPRDPSHDAEMLDKDLDSYPGAEQVTLNKEDPTDYVITTSKVELRISKTDSKMQLKNKQNGQLLWKEKEPLTYKDNNTIQTLETNSKEYFYGGGMTNGYFSHKGTSIDIVKNPNKWVDGYPASPTPFYVSSNGYGVMRYTWMEGVYDFGEEDINTVKTSHAEGRFDAFYYVEDKMDIVPLIKDFTDMTGDITLLPEYAYYIGHLNCYSRDTWKEDANGRYNLAGKKWTEDKNGTITESLMGADKPSAETMLNSYVEQDYPLGYFLPNDGYGCGYGREDTLDGNVANLNKFAEYAKGKNKETGLWTQSKLVPDTSLTPYLQRDLAKEVKAGVHALKTDVAWVGAGYSMALTGVKQASDIIESNSDYRRFIVSLDGWAGTQRYAGLWSGDQTGGDWEYIRFHIPTYIGSGLSGNPNVGSDQNGIWGQDPVIATRDYQWKSFSPIQLDMDGWSGEVKHPGYHDKYSGINRMYLKMKAQMLPYIYSIAREATDTSMPQIRAMMLEYPNDPYTYGTETQYQYMWGPNMLVAPVYRGDENAAGIRNNIYLPDENQVWVDYFTGKQYQGGQVLNNFDAPIWKQPVFIKNGAIIPMTEENNDPKEIAADATRTFEVWPAGDTSFKMYEDDGYSQEYKKSNAYAFTNITSSAPEAGTKGKATITVEKPVGNYSATGNSNSRATEFVVNVSEKPSTVTLKANGTNIEGITEVTTQEAYDEATGPVYFYNTEVDLNKYEKADSSFTTLIKTTPKLFVKTAKMDVTTNIVSVVLEGFNNDGITVDDGKTEVPATPTNVEFTATDAKIDFVWNGNENATSYEVRVGGEDQPIVKNILDTKYVAEGLTQDTEYEFSVRAVNSQGASEWATITSKTLLDRYRNVPKGMEISWSGAGSEPEIYAGTLKSMVDGDNSTEYSSKTAGVWTNGSFTINMNKVYSLEKMEYSFRKDKSNGAVKKFLITYSKDGKNWQDIEWSNIHTNAVLNAESTQLIDTLTFESPIEARYLKFTVKESAGGYLQGFEVRPYKVDKSNGYVLGDYSEDGVINDGDLVFMKNYFGTMQGDPGMWEYTGKADQNANGVIEGYDLAYLLSMFNGGNKPTGDVLNGNLVLSPSKTSLDKGETMDVSVMGIDLNDVYAFSMQVELGSKLSYVPNSVTKAPLSAYMSDYSKLSDSNGKLMIGMSNMGNIAPIRGAGTLATFKVKAKEATDTEELKALLANVISTDILEKNALVTDSTEDPIAPVPTETKVERSEIKSVTFTNELLPTDNGENAGKLLHNSTFEPLFDGNTASTDAAMLATKWDLPANYPEGSDKLPDYIKMPLDISVNFMEEKIIKSFKVYNRNGGNGTIQKLEAYGYLGEEEFLIGSYNTQQLEYEFTTDESHNVFDRIVIRPIETRGNATGYTANSNTNGNGNNRLLSIPEIEFTKSDYRSVDSVSFPEGKEISVPLNGSKPLAIEVLPDKAAYRHVRVESDNTDVVGIRRVVDAQGNASYLLIGIKAGKATITATSYDNPDLSATITATVKAGLDISELEKYSKEAEDKAPDLYSKDTWAAVEENLIKASDIIKNQSKYTQSDVNKVTLDLSIALSKLELRATDSSTRINEETLKNVTVAQGQGDSYATGTGASLFDNSPSTFFESPYSGSGAGLPKSILISLPTTHTLNQVDITPYSRNNGAPLQYEIAVSMDNETFTTVATGSIETSEYTKDQNFGTRELKFAETGANFVKITIVNAMNSNGTPNAIYYALSEIDLYGKAEVPTVAKVSISPKDAEMQAGTTLALKGTISPNGTGAEIAWTSSDSNIASVDENGVVSAKAEGSAVISATAQGKKATATIQVFTKKVLSDAIAKADEFLKEAVEQDYTVTSWTTFKNAYDIAKALMEKEPVTATEVIETAEALKTAQMELIELIPSDELLAKVEELKKITNGSDPMVDATYSTDSFDALQTAIENAQIAIDENDSEKMAVANKALDDAKDALVNIVALRDNIKKAEAALEENKDVTSASKASLQASIDGAKVLLANAAVSDNQVTDSNKDLTAKTNSLVSLEELRVAIQEAEEFVKENSANFTSDYAKDLQKAIASAKTTLEKADASKNEVTSATSNVKHFVSSPIFKANKEALKLLVEEYAPILKDGKLYTEASFKGFQEVYESAKKLIGNENATQSDVTKMIADLKKAKANLKAIPNKPVNPNTPIINPDKTITLPNHDGSITVTGKGLDLKTALYTNELSHKDRVAVINKIKDDKFVSQITFEKIINMYLLKGDVRVQPKEVVKVKLQLDKDLLNKNLGVVYIDNDGHLKIMKSWKEKGFLCFETNHFSNYGIVSFKGDKMPSLTQGIPETSDPVKGVQTGDTSATGMFTILLLLGGFVGIKAYKKTKKQI